MRRVIALSIIGLLALSALTVFMFQSAEPLVLQPAGEIAEKQRNLLYFASALSLVIIVPVFALTFFIVWRYRDTNHKTTKTKYQPNWGHSQFLETIWWSIPIIIILILAIVTWQSSHDLDPHKPLESTAQPVTVQVVALQWRWLFIYPEQGIATVNYLQFPEDTPLNLQITADAPMNAFWIPQLGGQVYAMAGMSTKLHLMADQPGVYTGVSSNLSGAGFADMRFTAESTSSDDFAAWVRSVQESGSYLTTDEYTKLAKASTNTEVMYFSTVNPELHATVIAKYMSHGSSHESAATTHEAMDQPAVVHEHEHPAGEEHAHE